MNGLSKQGAHAMANTPVGSRSADLRRPSQNMRKYHEALQDQLRRLAEATEREFGPVSHTRASKDTGTHLVEKPQGTAPQTRAAPSAPPTPAFAPLPTPALPPYQPQPPPTPSSPAPIRLRWSCALDAQTDHQWTPCWRPTSGTAGVPQTDSEQTPHVMRLLAAFIDTDAVLDDTQHKAQFERGGMWMHSQDDIELVCWNLVQVAISLHVVGAVGLQMRRMPGMRPSPESDDAKLTFGLRLFFLELLVRHYKVLAHKMMLGREVEETLMCVYTWLWVKGRFKEVLGKMTASQRAVIEEEFTRRAAESEGQAGRDRVGGQRRKRPASDMSPAMETAIQTPRKRKNRATANSTTNSPQTLLATSTTPLRNKVPQASPPDTSTAQVPAQLPSNPIPKQDRTPHKPQLPSSILDSTTIPSSPSRAPTPEQAPPPKPQPTPPLNTTANSVEPAIHQPNAPPSQHRAPTLPDDTTHATTNISATPAENRDPPPTQRIPTSQPHTTAQAVLPPHLDQNHSGVHPNAVTADLSPMTRKREGEAENEAENETQDKGKGKNDVVPMEGYAWDEWMEG